MKEKLILSLIKLIIEFERHREMNGGEDNLSEFLDWLISKHFNRIETK